MTFSAADHAYMARALALTQRGRYTATPNPNVGCVIVKAARIIGEGWHEKAGDLHAEAHALKTCSEDPRGATAYVTLEPCAHHGRTPPCADALIEAGMARVVAALEDPNPQVSGKGFARLREAGIQAESGLMAQEAALVHRGFLSRMTRARPWVRVKLGVSLDGRTALANGASRWITSSEARRDVHDLRAQACAVLTGIGTVRADNPRLTVRDVPCTRQPLRVLLDSRLEIQEDAALMHGGNLLIVTATGAESREEELKQRGYDVLRVPVDAAKGKVDLPIMMQKLAERGLNDLLVETGAKLNGSLLQSGVVDEIIIYIAPSILGDLARGMFAIGELATLEHKVKLQFSDVRQVGPDLRVIAEVLWN
jgi:diaminohydroxyphosphoribosylaminopyrimidine deaminase/5-amino-6-(5-phosphoribosylamino)uracil reductase